MTDDELWNVLQTLDATVNCMAMDQDTSDLVMRMQEEALGGWCLSPRGGPRSFLIVSGGFV